MKSSLSVDRNNRFSFHMLAVLIDHVGHSLFHQCGQSKRAAFRPPCSTIFARREEFSFLARSVARSVRKHVSTRDNARDEKDRAPPYRGCGSGVIIGPGPEERGLPATGTDVPSPRPGNTGSS